MTSPRVQYRCDGCGQTDDHPKMHYAQQTYHHDCIPAFIMDDLTHETYYQVENGQMTMTHRVPLPEEDMNPHTRRILELRGLAEKGTRGPKLLEKISSLPPADEAYGDNSGKEN